MIDFLWPWVLLLCVAPVLSLMLLKPRNTANAPLYVPEVARFRESIVAIGANLASRTFLRYVLICAMWWCLIFAIAQPRITGDLTAIPTSGRDMYLAVDASGSMNTEDMVELLDPTTSLTRLEAVKKVVTAFLASRVGDRVGLILFGTRPYVYTPLTFDLNSVDQLLQEAPGGIAGTQTSIGETVGLAVKRLRERSAEQRILILLTDGEQTTGSLSIEDAAELAIENQVKVHTIGFGTNSSSFRNSSFGSVGNWMVPEVDFSSLEFLAVATGGRHFRAVSTESLQEVYTTIDQLELIDQDPEKYRPVKALFYWPLAVGFACFLVLWMTRKRDA